MTYDHFCGIFGIAIEWRIEVNWINGIGVHPEHDR